MTRKFNPLNGKPKWLEEGRDISHTSESNRKHYLRSIKYYQQLYKATPSWYDEKHHKQILDIYKDCAKQRKFGKNLVVDHIVPVCSNIVCGLNVPWNYQIITERENSKKGNKYWPNMPNEQLELRLFLDLTQFNPQRDLFE